MIWDRYGRAVADLFASEETTHCPLWFSLTERTSPLGQDALAPAWPDSLLYAFPPIPFYWQRWTGSSVAVTAYFWWLHIGQEGHGSHRY